MRILNARRQVVDVAQKVSRGRGRAGPCLSVRPAPRTDPSERNYALPRVVWSYYDLSAEPRASNGARRHVRRQATSGPRLVVLESVRYPPAFFRP